MGGRRFPVGEIIAIVGAAGRGGGLADLVHSADRCSTAARRRPSRSWVWEFTLGMGGGDRRRDRRAARPWPGSSLAGVVQRVVAIVVLPCGIAALSLVWHPGHRLARCEAMNEEVGQAFSSADLEEYDASMAGWNGDRGRRRDRRRALGGAVAATVAGRRRWRRGAPALAGARGAGRRRRLAGGGRYAPGRRSRRAYGQPGPISLAAQPATRERGQPAARRGRLPFHSPRRLRAPPFAAPAPGMAPLARPVGTEQPRRVQAVAAAPVVPAEAGAAPAATAGCGSPPAAAAPAPAKFCAKCGGSFGDDATRFCTTCGAPRPGVG